MKREYITSDCEDAVILILIFISFLLFHNFGDNEYDLYDLLYRYLLTLSK